MTNSWTGGQYSLFRLIFGAYLCVHFAGLLPWSLEVFSSDGILPEARLSPLIYAFPNILAVFDSGYFVQAFVLSGLVASALFAVGFRDKLAAFWIWYVLACLFGRNPLTSNPSLPFVGWILLAHCLLPTAPYGSFAARNRPDPDGGWRFNTSLFTAAWILMAVGYSYSGLTKLSSVSWTDGTAFLHVLNNPLARPTALRDLLLTAPSWVFFLSTWAALLVELLFLPLCLLRKVRPVIWAAALLMHIGLVTLVDFADLSFGMVVLHLFTFDPKWVAAKYVNQDVYLYYDGDCGLCHRFVRFVLAENSTEDINFAPLSSDAFALLEARLPVGGNANSVVVNCGDEVYSKSAAVIAVLIRLGGCWRLVGEVSNLIPRLWLDAAYDFVATYRHYFFQKPLHVCPVLPDQYRRRFVI